MWPVPTLAQIKTKKKATTAIAATNAKNLLYCSKKLPGLRKHEFYRPRTSIGGIYGPLSCGIALKIKVPGSAWGPEATAMLTSANSSASTSPPQHTILILTHYQPSSHQQLITRCFIHDLCLFLFTLFAAHPRTQHFTKLPVERRDVLMLFGVKTINLRSSASATGHFAQF